MKARDAVIEHAGDMPVIVLNDWGPTEAVVNRWAYDENVCLTDQDEDLALHMPHYIPILIGLADDPRCPKADYILIILDDYLKGLSLSRDREFFKTVRVAVEIAAGAQSDRVLNFGRRTRRRLDMLSLSGPVDEALAREMGELILGRMFGTGTVSVSNTPATHWDVRLRWSDTSAWMKLSVEKASGRFLQSKGRD